MDQSHIRKNWKRLALGDTDNMFDSNNFNVKVGPWFKKKTDSQISSFNYS